jgi:hypothetical protein
VAKNNKKIVQVAQEKYKKAMKALEMSSESE